MAVNSGSGGWKTSLAVLASSVLLILSIHNVHQKALFTSMDDGVFWEDSQGRVYAKRIDPDGPGTAAGIREGDILVLLDNNPIKQASEVPFFLNRYSENRSVSYHIIREKARKAFSLQVVPLPTGNLPVYFFLAAVGIFSLVVGTVVYVRRRGVAGTAHFYFLCLFWFLMFGFSFTGELSGWDRSFFWMDQVGQLFFPPIFLHFALCFPTKLKLIKGRAWLLSILYIPSLVLFYLSLSAEILFFSSLNWGSNYFVIASRFLDRIIPAYVAMMSLLAFVAFVNSNRRARSITVKKQTKWIVWGTGFGTLPFALMYAIPYLLGIKPGLTMEMSVVPLALIPLSFAYAIVKYRLMDVEILFKRGMVFTLATVAVGVLYLAMFLAGVHYMVGDEHSTILALLSAIVVVLLFTPIKTRIQVAIDRLFYRERYDYRRALLAFSRDLNAHLDLDRLSSRLVDRIADTFEVEKVALLVPSLENGALRISAARGLSEDECDHLVVKKKSDLYERFSNGESVYYGEFDWNSSSHFVKGVVEDGLMIDELQYAIPCCSRDNVVGLILLGPRWNQKTLSSEDMELLDMLSGQAATALENAGLYRSLERKATELETLKEHSENTIESLEAGILGLDIQGNVVRFNSALEVLYGLPRDEALGKSFDTVFPNSLCEMLVSSMGENWWTRRELSGVLRLNLKNLRDEEKVVRVQVAPFLTKSSNKREKNEDSEGTVVIFEDVTKRVELETQLRLHEKLASLGLLAAGVAHEVNTPLTGISSFTQMLQDQIDKGDPKVKLLNKIERQTERASKIVNNLLNFARQGGSSFVPVAVNDVIRDVCSLLEHQLTRSQVKVRFELSGALPEVMGDENKLQQVFLNLILNAKDAMASGGQLKIKTSLQSENVVVNIADTGGGISKEDIKRIYDPFFTTKESGMSGTGLGLSISYGIIQEHAGSISVESSVGVGTSFEIRLSKLAIAGKTDPVLSQVRPAL